MSFANLMVKDSDGREIVRRNPFFVVSLSKKELRMKKPAQKKVIAHRKSCQAKGTGLSHYILMDKKAK